MHLIEGRGRVVRFNAKVINVYKAKVEGKGVVEGRVFRVKYR
jgi:hypothetical protein